MYTIKQNSVFILDVAAKEIKDNDGITFLVKDFDLVGKHDTLGHATVPTEKILQASGERLELQLRNKGEDSGFLAVRCRPVKEYEREFLATLTGKANGIDFMGVNASYVKAMNPFGAVGVIKDLVSRRTKMEHGVKKVRGEIGMSAILLHSTVILTTFQCSFFLVLYSTVFVQIQIQRERRRLNTCRRRKLKPKHSKILVGVSSHGFRRVPFFA